VPPRTIRLSSSDTATADKNADASHTLGRQAFVNTILRLRLRTLEEMINRPKHPANRRRYRLSVEKIPCRVLKAWTPESVKSAGRHCKAVNSNDMSRNAISKRLLR
jgi:aconitase A